MSANVNEPIYKTEVVKVSDMPQATYLDQNSLLLVAQNGRSKQLSYSTLERSIESDINGTIGPELKCINSAMKSLSSSIKNTAKSSAESDTYLSVELSQKIANANSYLSITLDAKLTNETDQKVKSIEDEFDQLDRYVKSQNLTAINAQFSQITNKLNYHQNKIEQLEKAEQDDIRDVTKELEKKIAESESRSKEYSHRELDTESKSIRQITSQLNIQLSQHQDQLSHQRDEIEQLEKAEQDDYMQLSIQVDGLSSEASRKISAVKQEMLSAISKSHNAQERTLSIVSSNLSDSIESTRSALQMTADILSSQIELNYDVTLELLDSQRQQLSSFGKEILSIAMSSDNSICTLISQESAILNASIDEATRSMTELSSKMSAEEKARNEQDNLLSTKLDQLDLQLYGLNIEAMNAEGDIVSENLDSGDIGRLSADITKIQSDISAISAELESIRSCTSSMILTADAYSIFALSAKSSAYASIFIKQDGYSPMSITDVIATDADNGYVLDDVNIYNRFICSDEKAKIYVENRSNDELKIKAIAKVVYMKSK